MKLGKLYKHIIKNGSKSISEKTIIEGKASDLKTSIKKEKAATMKFQTANSICSTKASKIIDTKTGQLVPTVFLKCKWKATGEMNLSIIDKYGDGEIGKDEQKHQECTFKGDACSTIDLKKINSTYYSMQKLLVTTGKPLSNKEEMTSVGIDKKAHKQEMAKWKKKHSAKMKKGGSDYDIKAEDWGNEVDKKAQDWGNKVDKKAQDWGNDTSPITEESLTNDPTLKKLSKDAEALLGDKSEIDKKYPELDSEFKKHINTPMKDFVKSSKIPADEEKGVTIYSKTDIVDKKDATTHTKTTVTHKIITGKKIWGEHGNIELTQMKDSNNVIYKLNDIVEFKHEGKRYAGKIKGFDDFGKKTLYLKIGRMLPVAGSTKKEFSDWGSGIYGKIKMISIDDVSLIKTAQ